MSIIPLKKIKKTTKIQTTVFKYFKGKQKTEQVKHHKKKHQEIPVKGQTDPTSHTYACAIVLFITVTIGMTNVRLRRHLNRT